jgi:hypothetical protein
MMMARNQPKDQAEASQEARHRPEKKLISINLWMPPQARNLSFPKRRRRPLSPDQKPENLRTTRHLKMLTKKPKLYMVVA